MQARATIGAHNQEAHLRGPGFVEQDLGWICSRYYWVWAGSNFVQMQVVHSPLHLPLCDWAL